ncbi:hypothetical protein E2C01_056634 [Portunus trituberculatus]|uniref:Uncharacterized protein n=1 Tax=Portunus trituberculatus TaxID=210409 RepID=A0A5B7H045_PORTR|nr:hypothetical protein [Portunus trituberculatus]
MKKIRKLKEINWPTKDTSFSAFLTFPTLPNLTISWSSQEQTHNSRTVLLENSVSSHIVHIIPNIPSPLTPASYSTVYTPDIL